MLPCIQQGVHGSHTKLERQKLCMVAYACCQYRLQAGGASSIMLHASPAQHCGNQYDFHLYNAKEQETYGPEVIMFPLDLTAIVRRSLEKHPESVSSNATAVQC